MSGLSPQRNDPNHIGIIMDGNGRWAKQRGLARPLGHREGAKAVRKALEGCQELGVRYLTLYAFSTENWSRPDTEVRALMELLEHFLGRETKSLVKRGVRLRAVGRIAELPERAQAALNKAMEATARFDEWNLTLALNYSSRNEVLDAAVHLARDIAAGAVRAEALDWATFSRYLYTRELPDPDLIIRTSGETRISNFLLMQSAYSEFFFTDTLWPDFDQQRLKDAVERYRCRERRFGKTGEQLLAPLNSQVTLP